MEPVRMGVVGCGNISGIYLKNAARMQATEVVALADLDLDRARAKADEFGIADACTTEQLLARDDVELVLNLTIPKAHYPVAGEAISAGKHVYNEKPLTIATDEAKQLLADADAKGLKIGCAPDTFLGAGLQTCRQLIDEGTIGKPVAASAFMMCPGHESWHPDPEFYYAPGGGPMLDMGPYYVTALVSLLGPARRVTGSAQAGSPTRTITSEPKRGKVIEVETPTHIAGVIDFVGGAVATIVTSFDVAGHSMPPIEIYGTEATLCVPDPNTFGGPVAIRKSRRGEPEDVPVTRPYAQNSRGLGPADLAVAARNGRKARAGGELALHVLEIMNAFYEASQTGRHVELTTTCNRPAPLPADLAEGQLDD